MTLRPLQRAALVALGTAGVLAGMTGTLTPAATADRPEAPALVGPAAPGKDFIGPSMLERGNGQSALHARDATEPLARKFK